LDKTTDGENSEKMTAYFKEARRILKEEYLSQMNELDEKTKSSQVTAEQKYYLLLFQKQEKKIMELYESLSAISELIARYFGVWEKFKGLEKIVSDLAQQKTIDPAEINKLNKAIASDEFKTVYDYVKRLQEQIIEYNKRKEANDLAT